jgi:GTP-binding protein
MSTAIALVGRPNVGKSRLFNRLVHRRISIVHDQPGTTRDVIVEELENGAILMDTGGIGLGESQEDADILSAVEEQVYFAIQAADVIFFVVDGRSGCVALDCEIAAILRKSGKKTHLIVNKIDSENEISRSDVFHVLGFDAVLLVSAEHGYGERDLLETINAHVPSGEGQKPKVDSAIKICLSGRPNVGKSSIANALLKESRMIASPTAGTTRDAICCDLFFRENEREYSFKIVDTAGLREKKKVDNSKEFFSALRSRNAMNSAMWCF